MKKLLVAMLFLGIAYSASAIEMSLPQDLNGRVITDVSMMGSSQAGRSYSFDVGDSTTGVVAYDGPALFYGFCVSSAAAADQYIILRDTDAVTSAASTTYNLFGTKGVMLTTAGSTRGFECYTFPVPIKLERGLEWKGNNVAIGTDEVVTFFLLGL